jgi:tetratricopeptide (TPR) repeat protein
MVAVSLQQGIQALKQGDLPGAIQTLESICNHASTDTQARFQAQGWLVRAYLKAGEQPKALALCQQLTQADNPQIRDWAVGKLSKLSAQSAAAKAAMVQTPEAMLAEADGGSADVTSGAVQPLGTAEPLSLKAAEQLLETGIKELRRRDYSTAIATLEDFIGGTDESYPNHAWGRTSLAKAYKGNEQYEAAITLCKSMLESDRESTRAWGRDFLKSLPQELINPASAAPVDASNPMAESPAARQTGSIRPIVASRPQTRTAVIPTGKTAPDLTPQILSGLAHGSVSLLASLLLFLLFADSIAANALGLLRLAVPVVILLQTQDPTVKTNAREATNYVITSIAWIIFLAAGNIFLALGMMALGVIFWPFLLLLGAAILGYMLAFSFWPIYAAIVSFRQPERVVRYPSWLVWHLL